MISNVYGCSLGKEKNNQDNADYSNVNISEENGADSINEGGEGEVIPLVLLWNNRVLLIYSLNM